MQLLPLILQMVAATGAKVYQAKTDNDPTTKVSDVLKETFAGLDDSPLEDMAQMELVKRVIRKKHFGQYEEKAEASLYNIIEEMEKIFEYQRMASKES